MTARSRAALRTKLAVAVSAWFEKKKPLGWSRERHLSDATVNCKNVEEVNIALAWAEMGRK